MCHLRLFDTKCLVAQSKQSLVCCSLRKQNIPHALQELVLLWWLLCSLVAVDFNISTGVGGEQLQEQLLSAPSFFANSGMVAVCVDSRTICCILQHVQTLSCIFTTVGSLVHCAANHFGCGLQAREQAFESLVMEGVRLRTCFGKRSSSASHPCLLSTVIGL